MKAAITSENIMSAIALFSWLLYILSASAAASAWEFNCTRKGGRACRILGQQYAEEGAVTLNVLDYGARGDGKADDTQAFAQAWKAACKKGSSLVVPQGQSFLIGPTTFAGPCASSMTLQIAGEIVAPAVPSAWGKLGTRTWLVFSHLGHFTIEGGGTIDGQGQNWWAKSCKVNKNNPCTKAPTALTVSHSTNVIIQDLNFKNAQQMHLHIDRSNVVTASRITIAAPQTSPNTDGIHISNSQNVVIESSTIGTGDDCISISSGTSGLQIKDITCGPGHGVSIGSLGEEGAYSHVENVVVAGATLDGTSNGLRIKTWQGGKGSATNIRYQNVKMSNVNNPIVIDQYYCDSQRPCRNQTSAVQVSDISYTNIEGSSSVPVAVRFACSETIPCSGIRLNNIDLQYGSAPGSTRSFCVNAKGTATGTETPISCLQ